MIHVISTAHGSPSRERCIASVASQSGVDVVHTYLDAADRSNPGFGLSATQNVYSAARRAHYFDIIACVDGDDWLPHSRALEHVARIYRDTSCWLTYGSYVHADGRPGHCAEYAPDEAVRRAPWRASHLKTFRAGLFHRLTPEDLQIDGQWLDRCVDLAVMFPLIELAGWDRCRFVSEILYVYNIVESWEWNERDRWEKERARGVERNLRARPPKSRLVSL